jgi:Tol biopolymer transport system component
LTRLALVAVVLAITAVAAFLFSRRTAEVRHQWTFSPITTYPGFQFAPRLSPDGQFVAFFWSGRVSDTPGLRLYVKAIGTEEPRVLSRAGWGAPAWSPDGRFIAFSLRERDKGGIYMVPALGGAERVLAKIDRFPTSATLISPEIDWSPDGKLLVFATSEVPDTPGQVFVLNTENGQRAPINMPTCTAECRGDANPVFSPDGRWLAIYRGFTQKSIIYVVPALGGTPRELAAMDGDLAGMDWTADGLSLVVAHSTKWWDEGSTAELVRMDVADGRTAPLGLKGVAPTVARHARRLAFIQRHRTVNVWRWDLTRAGAAPIPLLMSSRIQQAAKYSPDGTKIVFESNRTGEQEIWMCKADGTDLVQLTDLKTLTGTPNWSPDSKKIVFDTLTPNGTQQLVVLDIESGSRRTISTGRASASVPSWSADGQFIYFADSDLGRRPQRVAQLWKVPASGGEAVQLTRHGGSLPVQPPGSDFIYYAQPDPKPIPGHRAIQEGFTIWQVRPDGTGEGPIEGLPPLNAFVPDWGATQEGLYFIDAQEVGPALKFFDFRRRQLRLLGRLQYPRTPWQPAISVSPDGRYLLYAQTDSLASDVMLVENFQ